MNANTPKVVAVIPARMSSSRFPGKPLAPIMDLPMIEHVRRRVELASCIDAVCVATCDEAIKQVVEENGGRAVMTSHKHERCTDRVEEAVEGLAADIVVIISGDEPLVLPEVLELFIEPMRRNPDLLCTNLLSVIHDQDDLNDPDIVKAVVDINHFVLFYSRAPIPVKRAKSRAQFYRQSGFSAFRKDFLKKFSRLPPTPLEQAESIDFLRIIEHRYPILGVIDDRPTYGVDQEEHVALVEGVIHRDPRQRELYQKTVNRCAKF